MNPIGAAVAALMFALPSIVVAQDITSTIVSYEDWAFIHLKSNGEKAIVSLETSRPSETARTETGLSVSCHGLYFDAMAPMFIHDTAKNRVTVTLSTAALPNQGWEQPLNLQPDNHIAGIAFSQIMWVNENRSQFFLTRLADRGETLNITFRYADGELHRSTFSLVGFIDSLDYLARVCSV